MVDLPVVRNTPVAHAPIITADETQTPNQSDFLDAQGSQSQSAKQDATKRNIAECTKDHDGCKTAAKKRKVEEEAAVKKREVARARLLVLQAEFAETEKAAEVARCNTIAAMSDEVESSEQVIVAVQYEKVQQKQKRIDEVREGREDYELACMVHYKLGAEDKLHIVDKEICSLMLTENPNWARREADYQNILRSNAFTRCWKVIGCEIVCSSLGRNLTSHSPELCHILSRLLNLKNVSTKHFTSEKLASLVANMETLGRFLVSRSSYIQHKDFVRLTTGSHGWTTIRATYHTQKTGAPVHHGSRILARRKLNCHVCSKG
jgi:hypothetical protein